MKEESKDEIVIYQTKDGKTALEVNLRGETVWLNQGQMSVLFDRDRSIITKHLRNIFQSGELIRDSVCANFALTAADGKTYQTAFYNLDAVISVGYRVNSKRGIQFRIWATSEPLIMMKPEELWTVYAGNSVLQTSSAWKLTTA